MNQNQDELHRILVMNQNQDELHQILSVLKSYQNFSILQKSG